MRVIAGRKRSRTGLSSDDAQAQRVDRRRVAALPRARCGGERSVVQPRGCEARVHAVRDQPADRDAGTRCRREADRASRRLATRTAHACGRDRDGARARDRRAARERSGGPPVADGRRARPDPRRLLRARCRRAHPRDLPASRSAARRRRDPLLDRQERRGAARDGAVRRGGHHVRPASGPRQGVRAGDAARGRVRARRPRRKPQRVRRLCTSSRRCR